MRRLRPYKGQQHLPALRAAIGDAPCLPVRTWPRPRTASTPRCSAGSWVPPPPPPDTQGAEVAPRATAQSNTAGHCLSATSSGRLAARGRPGRAGRRRPRSAAGSETPPTYLATRRSARHRLQPSPGTDSPRQWTRRDVARGSATGCRQRWRLAPRGLQVTTSACRTGSTSYGLLWRPCEGATGDGHPVGSGHGCHR